ncbi:L-dopachrome tautomerase yellow-f2-like [Lutzomyia longipalpis]|uniref:L-dopachrome tautomerase yellow-f2-like n=1 Tax=Lutzomyia longipalpis TaxID=7200 RepID=UPI0024845BA8|nr:L-dopachrome tautomerase yellow-f2-like [Lutzomyia longipalpis]
MIGKYPYYIPANNEVIGLGYHAASGLMLAAVGRIRPGVPSTLNAFCMEDYHKGTSPHLWGFPNYKMNTLQASFYDEQIRNIRSLNTSIKYSAGYFKYFFGDQHEMDLGRRDITLNRPYNSFQDFTIIHTFRPIVDDRCNRLFIIDNGVLNYGLNLRYNVQNPAIVVFQLPTGRCSKGPFPVLRRIEIPSYMWKEPIGFAYITLDYQKRGSCDDLFLYITNTFDTTITVYDYKRGTFWKFSDPSMRPVYAESLMTFGNDFQYINAIGIMDIVLGWPDKDGNRNAYYTPGTSLAQYVVSTKLLKNSKRASYNYNPEEFTLIGYRGCGTENFLQTIDLSTGVIFFAQMQSKKLLCWNIQYPYNPDTIGVLYESDALQFVSSINIDAEGYLCECVEGVG